MAKLETQLKSDLAALREQGKVITSVNPIAILADRLSQDLDSGVVGIGDIAHCLADLSQKVLHQRAHDLAAMVGIDADSPLEPQRDAVCRIFSNGPPKPGKTI